MGSKLTVLAAVICLGGTAVADNAALKKGIELYKAGKYAEARIQIEKAYKADPKPETLFALAQTERLAGDCVAAAAHYKQVIAEVSDLNVAKLVQQSLLLCEPEQAKPEPTVQPPKVGASEPPPPVEPKIVEKIVFRDQTRTDKVAVAMLGGGMLALGAAAGLYVAASSNADAADLARSLADHDSLADKAKSERTLMYVAAGAGALMLGVAVYRFATGGRKTEKSDAGVAVIPNESGGSLLVTSRF